MSDFPKTSFFTPASQREKLENNPFEELPALLADMYEVQALAEFPKKEEPKFIEFTGTTSTYSNNEATMTLTVDAIGELAEKLRSGIDLDLTSTHTLSPWSVGSYVVGGGGGGGGGGFVGIMPSSGFAAATTTGDDYCVAPPTKNDMRLVQVDVKRRMAIVEMNGALHQFSYEELTLNKTKGPWIFPRND